MPGLLQSNMQQHGALHQSYHNNSNDTRNLKQILEIYGFSQVIKDPTRTTLDSKTIIDHIITNRTDLVRNCGVVHCGINDHDAVFLQKNMRKPKLKLSSKTITARNYKHFDRAAFLNDIKMTHFDQIKSYTSDANEMWALWKKLFLDILNKHAPTMYFKIKGKNMPYITSDLKQMIRQRDYLKAKALKTGSKILHQAFHQIRAKVYYTFNKIRTEYCTKKLNETKGDML